MSTTYTHPKTAAPRFICTAVSIVVGPDRSKQEQVQLRRLPGTSRLIFPGLTCIHIEDNPEAFGTFEAGRIYELQLSWPEISEEETAAIFAVEEEASTDPIEKMLEETSSLFAAMRQAVERRLTPRSGASVPIAGEISPVAVPSGAGSEPSGTSGDTAAPASAGQNGGDDDAPPVVAEAPPAVAVEL